jgi:hypothetical protein
LKTTKEFLQVPYDEWNKKLDEQIIILQECQQKYNLLSCESCTKILKCEIRKSYVKAVYESMNKGSGGGFEF